MNLFSRTAFHLKSLFFRRALDAQLSEEVRTHVEMATEANVARGMSRDDARCAALREFGNVANIQEQARDARGWLWLEQLGQDLRHGLRLLLRERAFTATCVLVFALGIGANATIFSALNSVVLRALPVPEADRLMRFWGTNEARKVRSFSISHPDYRDWAERTTSWELLDASDRRSMSLVANGEPEQVVAHLGTHQTLPLFGLRVTAGRAWGAEEDQPGKGRVVVLSDSFWRRRFAAGSEVLGSEVTIAGKAYTVIGVLAPASSLFAEVDLFLPAEPFVSPDRTDRDLDVFGRLKPGVSPEQAQAEIIAVMAGIAQAHPNDNAGWSARIEPVMETFVGMDARRAFFLVMAAGGLLLAVTCANLAGLLLVRASSRTRELAVRAALGGGRGRLVRQLTTEAGLLAALGGGAGLLCAVWGEKFLQSLAAVGVPRAAEITVDARVLAFTFGLTVLTGLLAGMLPALTASRVDILRGLRMAGPGATGRPRLRNALIAGQLALSVVLLAAAGLLVQTFERLQRTDLGFRPEGVLTARLTPTRNAKATIEALVTRAAQLPGVIAASSISSAPMANYNTSNNVFPVGPAAIPATQSIQCEWRIVTADYFRTMQIPVLRGRAFQTNDDGSNGRVVIVNQSLAGALWGDEDPIGKQISPGGGTTYSTVVGVVGDVRSRDPTRAPGPAYFLPAHRSVWGSMTLVVRHAGEGRGLVAQIRDEMRAVDPSLPLFDIRTMEESVAQRIAPQRAGMLVLAGFAGISLLLAATGLYGAMAQANLQRTREIGIRFALGAQKSDVLRPLLKDGIRLICVGMAAGLVLAAGVFRLLGGLLPGVQADSLLPYAGAAAILAVVAFIACWLPARRAAKVDPMVALRAE